MSQPGENEKTKSNEADYSAAEPKCEKDIVWLGSRPFEIGRKESLIRKVTILKVPRPDAEEWRIGEHFSS